MTLAQLMALVRADPARQQAKPSGPPGGQLASLRHFAQTAVVRA